MEERHRTPFPFRSTSCSEKEIACSSEIPSGLIGPTSEVPVQIEGIYTKALLDSGSQVTILYRSFYDMYLKHLPLLPVENLEIWGLSSHKYPYDGYLPIKLEFTENVVGLPQIVDTLALVCPDSQPEKRVAVLVGTNTNIVRRLFEACKQKLGDHFLHTLSVHPVVREVYENIQKSDGSPDDCERHGTVWFTQHKPIVVGPGESRQIQGKPKLFVKPTDVHVLIDQPDDTSVSDDLLVRPEVQSVSVVSNRIITVTVRNMSTKDVHLKRGTPIAHLYPVDIVPQPTVVENKLSNTLTPASFDFGNSPLPEDAKQQLCEQLMEKHDVFSCHEWDVGRSKSTKHEIRLTDSTPFRERSRRLPPADLQDVRNHLMELQKCGIISESRSPYASPIVVVRKKSGKVRMCVDYRTLNRRTIPDQYTVPRVEDALHSLVGSKWFSVLDLRSGYYQIPMEEADKEKTAFICPLGFYQFECMPQGISGAPATFQRVMEKTLGDMNFLEVLVYLDDLIVFGRTLEEHNQRLLKVLDRLREEGLKLSLDKCQFCRTSVTYVGHIVSQDGIATDPSKVEAVVNWPRPQTVTQLRSFLGFCGYYRRFVKGYSSLCRPLNQLLKGYPQKRQGKENIQKSATDGYFRLSDPFGSRWDDSCEMAFRELKLRLTQAPVLAFADPELPYVLHVDASMDGLGGVLYQQHPEGLRPVAFISRSLSTSERNYPAHKLEFLALKWAVVDKLHDYLYGVTFEVRTDNNPLTYILTSAKLDATGHRWLAALSTYQFSLKYRRGLKNIDADFLSRRPHSSSGAEENWEEVSASGVRTLCQSVETQNQVRGVLESTVVYQQSVHLPKSCCPESGVLQAAGKVVSFTQNEPNNSDSSELREAQGNDPCLSNVRLAVSQKQSPESVQLDHVDLKALKKKWKSLEVDQGLLYRVVGGKNNQRYRQLVLPTALRSTVLESLHDKNGHLGFEKTYTLVRDRFFWPRMKAEVEAYCKNCDRCIMRKTLPQRSAPMSHMHSSGPLDLVCIDFLTIEPDTRNVSNVLVITDHFTRYAQAFPCKDQKALTVARTLWEKYFVHYGLPNRIHSDQGRDFESRLIKEMLAMLGVKKSRTTPYHPQGDPQPERFNRTLLNMLGTLNAHQKSRWSQHIAQLVHSYNSTQNDATGYTPYFLMFGREPKLPVDVCLGVRSDEDSPISYGKYVERMRQQLKDAYELATAESARANKKNKLRYDKRMHLQSLSPGDRVLIQNLGLKGKHKLADRWHSVPYVVESQLSNLPVYKLVPESGNGPKKVLHRNHILPLKSQVIVSPESESPSPLPVRKTRKKRSGNEKPVSDPVYPEQRDFSSSDSESEYGYGPFMYVDPKSAELEYPDQDRQHRHAVVPDVCSLGQLLGDPDETLDTVNVDTEIMGGESEIEQHLEHTDNLPEPSVPVTSRVEPSDVFDTSQVRRSERQRKPPERFTYPELGRPVKETIVTSYCCEVGGHGTESSCFCKPGENKHVWWCNSQALCNMCMRNSKIFPCTVPRV